MAGVLAMALVLADTTNPIQGALDRYRDVAAYQMVLKSSSGGKTEIMRYYFKKPGHVRMEFVRPFNGAVIIYDPVKKEARVWPFGYRSFPSFTMRPETA